MHVLKLYIGVEELSDYVKSRLSEKEKFRDNLFVPINIGINENDMSVEFLFVTT